MCNEGSYNMYDGRDDKVDGQDFDVVIYSFKKQKTIRKFAWEGTQE